MFTITVEVQKYTINTDLDVEKTVLSRFGGNKIVRYILSTQTITTDFPDTFIQISLNTARIPYPTTNCIKF